MTKRMLELKSIEETQQLGEKYARKFKNGGVLLLFGDLGSGKTTFTQGLAKALGIIHHIISPTFLIVRTYDLPDNDLGKLYHIDLYRIESVEEIEDLGMREILDNPHNLIVIEWAEKMKKLMPPKRSELHFRYIDDSSREIEEIVYD